MLWSKCSCKKFIFHLQSQKSTETAIEIWLSITENRPDRRIDNINLDLSDAEEVKAPLSIAIRPCSVGQGGQCRGVDSKGIVRNNSCKGQMTCSWKWAASLYVVTFPFRRPPFTPTSTEGSSKTPQMPPTYIPWHEHVPCWSETFGKLSQQTNKVAVQQGCPTSSYVVLRGSAIETVRAASAVNSSIRRSPQLPSLLNQPSSIAFRELIWYSDSRHVCTVCMYNIR